MQNFTPPRKTSFNLCTDSFFKADAFMQPSEQTIQNILAFAAVYRAQEISDEQYVSYCLN